MKKLFILLVGMMLIVSACQQTQPVKPKSLFDSLWGATIPTPTNRQCFTTTPTKQRTKNTVFMLAAGANTGELTETANDVEKFSQTMQQHFNVPNNQICKLTNAFKAELENALHSLKQHLINDDLVIIYFSGHGGHIRDNNGDEKDGWDEALITYDIKGKDDINVKDSDVLRDDHFIALVNVLTTAKILTIMDTCFSSDMYLGQSQLTSGNARIKSFVKGEIGTQLPNLPKDKSHIIKIDDFDTLKGLLLAAASEDQKALEIPNQGGLFTTKFVQQIKEPGDIKQAFVRAVPQVQIQSNEFQQTPQAIGEWKVVGHWGR